MKALICGAGIAGASIAKYLSEEGNEVVVIDKDEALLDEIKTSLDVQTVLGYASYPSVLQKAGLETTDVLIAITGNDELNLIISTVASRLASIPTKIVRLKTKEYDLPELSKVFNVDYVISPDDEIADSILRTLQVAKSLNVISLKVGGLYFLGQKLLENGQIEGLSIQKVQELFPDTFVKILAIIRDGQKIDLTPETQLLSEDDVYFIAKSLNDFPALFGQKEENKLKRFVLFGGGRISYALAKQLEERNLASEITLIEKNKERALFLASNLSKTLVLEGDALNTEILKEAHLEAADASFALTEDDENNILLSSLSKKNDVKRTFALLNKSSYDSFVNDLGIDVVVNVESVTVSTILNHIKKGNVKKAYTLPFEMGTLLEVKVEKDFLSMKKDVLEKLNICTFIRRGKAKKIELSELKEGDVVLLLLDAESDSKIKDLFN